MLRKVSLFTIIIMINFSNLLTGSTKIIAHRGASSVAPENTMAAFSKAIAFGSDFFELDVMVSRDDSLMILHDDTIDRTTNGTGTVRSMYYLNLRDFDAGSWFGAEFAGEKIPTLAEALDLAWRAPYKVELVIEIKADTPTIVEKVLAEVQKRKMEQRVIISSFNLSQITRSKTLAPTIPVQLFGAITQTNIEQVAAIGGEWVGTSGVITQALLDSAHAKKILVNKWTVNSASEMVPLLKIGVDAITTNYPQTALALADSTPPTDVSINAVTINVTQVILSWNAAIDPQSGIEGYEIYRDTAASPAKLLTTVKDTTTFVDETHQEAQTFYYRIRARNAAGLLSINYSNEIMATTTLDRQAPLVRHINSFGASSTVIVTFNELVEKTSAEKTSNYQINHSILVHNARLALDSTSVILTTSELAENTDYTISIAGVRDRAKSPNSIMFPIDIPFSHHHLLPQSVAAWDLDEGEGTIMNDYAGNLNQGTLFNGVEWNAGYSGNGLHFDGIDDYAMIPASNSLNISGNSITLSLWTMLEYLPNDLLGSYGPIYDSETDNYVIYEDKGTNELRFKVTTLSSAERPGIAGAQLKVNEWLHVVGVYDGNNAMIYLNGILKDKHPLKGNVKTGQVALLGKSAGSFFKGTIDNIMIFSRALSEKEILFLYTGQKVATGLADDVKVSETYKLSQNYPNPFNPQTTIDYFLPRKEMVHLVILDLLGRKVTELVNQLQNPGNYQVNWNGCDRLGSPVSSGIYFYQITVGKFKATRKMTLLR